MIDEKKIEAAAKHYAEENSMSIEDQMGDMYDGIEELSDAYKAGANWAINEFLKDLWHPASEEPERDRDILLEYENGHPSDARMRLPYQYENIYSDLCEKYWSVMVKIEKITRWLYIDDLLKGRRQP